MAFDIRQFSRAQFEPRIERVSVPTLAAFFADGEAQWAVRGLTADEIARSNEAGDKRQSLSSMMVALESVSQGDQVKQLRSALGLTDRSPDEVVRRLEHLVAASVDPIITLDVAVKLARVYPVEFYLLTNRIVELTGQGQVAVKKPLPSGESPE